MAQNIRYILSHVINKTSKVKKKGNKSNNEIKQKKKKLNGKKREKMQVLKDSKVKFVSAVDVRHITSFWIISDFLTAPSLTVLLFFFF